MSRAAALLLALGFALPVLARAETPDWLRIEQRPGRETRVPGSARQVLPARLGELARAGHPFVDVVRSTELVLDAEDGLSERTILVRRFLNDVGVRDHGNLTRSVRAQAANVSLEEAWVELPDGAIADFDPATLQVTSEADPDVFSDVQRLVFPFAGLRPGATLVLVIREEIDLTKWPLHWSRIYFPQLLQPTELFEVSVSWDADRTDAPTWAKDDPQLACASGPGSLRCSRALISPLPYDPVVNWSDELPHLTVGAPASWTELAARERGIVLKAAAARDGIEALDHELGLQRGTARERVERIHRFVADRVRYVAFEHGTRAVVPHDASETLARRFGDCKDKVALFLALADRARVAAYPVLVATDRYSLDRLIHPSWRYFDHMIVCASVDGDTLCIDLTDPYSVTGDLPVSIGGAVALPLRPDAARPELLPRLEHGWRIEVEAFNEVACDGAILERLTRRFVGPAAGWMRAELISLSDSDRSRWLKESYAEVMGDIEPEVSTSGLDDPSANVELVSTTRFEGRSPLAEHTHWAETDAWLSHYAQLFRNENHHHPYRMLGLRLSSRNEYRLCNDVRVRFVGADLELASDLGSVRRRYHLIDSQALRVATEVDLPQRVLRDDELGAFNRFLDRSLDQTRIWFGIEASTEERR
ncbi:MAG: DUF3857 domain-containing protein [Myxococcota bacterium]